MSNWIGQLKKMVCNIIAWLLIWIVAVLAIPVGIILLVIYGIRKCSDIIIRRIDKTQGIAASQRKA